MTVPAMTRHVETLEDRAHALSHFFLRAGEAPRLLAYDDAVGCPMLSALAALEWTTAVGILSDDDVIHAARLSGDTAAALVERRHEGKRQFVYAGPRMDAPPALPTEGVLLYDQPGVRAYQFADRSHGIAHFLRATSGTGAVLSLLARRGPELRYVKRWLPEILSEPLPGGSPQLVAAHFSAAGAGCLFAPSSADESHVYVEVELGS